MKSPRYMTPAELDYAKRDAADALAAVAPHDTEAAQKYLDQLSTYNLESLRRRRTRIQRDQIQLAPVDWTELPRSYMYGRYRPYYKTADHTNYNRDRWSWHAFSRAWDQLHDVREY